VESNYGLAKLNDARRRYISEMKAAKLYAIGWGQDPVLKRYPAHRELPPHGERAGLRERWIVARQRGIKLVRATRYGALRVFRRLTFTMRPRSIPAKIAWDPRAAKRWRHRPLPDARFFNACLDLFGKQPNMLARNVKSWRLRGRWMRRFQSLVERERRARAPPSKERFLPYLLSWMRQLRFPVPLAFAHVRSAHDDKPAGFEAPELTEPHIRNRLRVRPFAYPTHRYDFHAYRLPVSKDRGLPIRRKGGYAQFRQGANPPPIVYDFGQQARTEAGDRDSTPGGGDDAGPTVRQDGQSAAAAGGEGSMKKRQYYKERPPRIWKPKGQRVEPSEKNAGEALKKQRVAAALAAEHGPSRWDITSAHSQSKMSARPRMWRPKFIGKVEPLPIEEAEADWTVDHAFSVAM